jgi:hypothetical protein
MPCEQGDCDGEVRADWSLHGELSTCDKCGHTYRVWGDETYNEETSECFDWWALSEPDGDNPWL